MRFQGVSRSDVDYIKATLRSLGPFLLPLSEPHQSEDGTIFVKSLENVVPLSEFTKLLLSRKIPTVMMWYTESILGVEARLNLRVADSPLQRDDIVVDRCFRFLVKCRALFDDDEESVWQDFVITLWRRAGHHQDVLDTTFLTDDIFKPARSSILFESQHHFTRNRAPRF
ncbi:hypothetical protein BLNAU_23910 [Blattamonas nauphoetae]|uniref:Uncharacterized protein n=1 Tax=Blattamonas nauphoetae TaxID=2049346 RepID=A0ABQ9WNY0_9EUKA|nr:hypothetical protein BLNAU_23910 [Blattamonas nauphoetae]